MLFSQLKKTSTDSSICVLFWGGGAGGVRWVTCQRTELKTRPHATSHHAHEIGQGM